MWKLSILGSVRYKVEDANVALINKLRKFKPHDICLNSGILAFSAPLIHRREVLRVLRGKIYYSCENRNLFSIFNFFYSRTILTFTALICFAAFITLDNFIFKVKLHGVTDSEYAQVTQYLNSQKIKPFMIKPKQTLIRTQNLVTEFDFIAAANIQVKGSNLIITVHRAENISAEIEETANIISTADGVISKLIVFNGTALVTVGDVVRIGDILVQGPRASAIITISNGAEHVCTINQTVVSS